MKISQFEALVGNRLRAFRYAGVEPLTRDRGYNGNMWKILTLAGLVGGLAAGPLAGCGTARPARLAQAKAPPAAPITTPGPTGTASDDQAQPQLSTAALVAILTSPQPATPMTIVRISDAELDAATPVTAPESQTSNFVDAAALEVQGKRTRIAFDMPEVRMLLWVPSAMVARYIVADLELPQPHSFGSEPPGYAKLRAGALVEVLSHTDDKIAIRHVGALQVSGTVPRSALTSSVPERRNGAPAGYNSILTIPGALIRQQPTVIAPVLATVNTAYQLVRLRSVDATWDEVAYSDFAVDVRGYYAKTMPPGSRNGQWRARSQLSLENSGDTTLPAGTCLYASVGGAITGIIKSDCAVNVITSARSGWRTAEVATPWGPLTVALRTTAPATGHLFANCNEP